MVEENEDMDLSSVEKLYDELKKDYFKDIPLDMIHGKMSSKVKEDIMNRFKTGKNKSNNIYYSYRGRNKCSKCIPYYNRKCREVWFITASSA